MARLRHFAIVVRDLEKSAKFYEDVFGLKRVGQEKLDFAAAVYLSDGVINLALLNYFGSRGSGCKMQRTTSAPIISAFRSMILRKPRRRIESAGGTFFFDLGNDQEKENFERKFKDPDGIIFDISKKGWLGATGLAAKPVEPSMIKVRRIGYATFETPDLEKAVAYYTQVNGLTLARAKEGRAFLATKIGQLVVALEQGQKARCLGLSFEVAPSADFAAMRRQLSDEGIQSEERRERGSRHSQAVVVSGSKWNDCRALFRMAAMSATAKQVAGVGPLKLGHVAFFAPDPKSIATFYEHFLGFRVSDWIDDFFVFMRCGPDHHSVNFLRGDVVRVHHFAFELKDFSHMANACDLLAQARNSSCLGPVAIRSGSQRRRLSSQPG